MQFFDLTLFFLLCLLFNKIRFYFILRNVFSFIFYNFRFRRLRFNLSVWWLNLWCCHFHRIYQFKEFFWTIEIFTRVKADLHRTFYLRFHCTHHTHILYWFRLCQTVILFWLLKSLTHHSTHLSVRKNVFICAIFKNVKLSSRRFIKTKFSIICIYPFIFLNRWDRFRSCRVHYDTESFAVWDSQCLRIVNVFLLFFYWFI